MSTITTFMRLFPSEWNPEEQRIQWDGKNSMRKVYLEELQYRIEKERKQLFLIARKLEEEGTLHVDRISFLYRQKYRDYTWNALLKNLSGELIKSGQFRTAEAYGSSVGRLLGFVGKKDMSLKKTDTGLIRRFERHFCSKETDSSLRTETLYLLCMKKSVF